MPAASTARLLAAIVAAISLQNVAPERLSAQNHPVLAAETALSEAAGTAGLRVALASTLHPDGILLWPGAPVIKGAANVPSFLAAQPLADSLRFAWQTLGAELSSDSTLGATWGVAAAAPRSGATAPRLGRYIAAWRRDGDRWTLAAMVLQGLTPAGSTTVPQGFSLQQPPVPASGPAGPFVAGDLAFAKLAGDSGAGVAFERFAAEDAVVGGGLQYRGPKAIGQGFTAPASWRWHPVAAGASRNGELGWTVGESVITPEGAPATYGKYLTIWRRLPDGSVRYLTDGGNARPATP